MWKMIILAVLAGSSGPSPGQTQSAVVEVRISGAVPGGPVMLQLCTEAEFRGRCAHQQRLRPDARGNAVARFGAVTPGRYAVGAFQDVNGNGRLDFGRMGAPTEPWGFSRDAPAVMGPPSFSDAVVPVTATGAVIPVRLGGL